MAATGPGPPRATLRRPRRDQRRLRAPRFHLGIGGLTAKGVFGIVPDTREQRVFRREMRPHVNALERALGQLQRALEDFVAGVAEAAADARRRDDDDFDDDRTHLADWVQKVEVEDVGARPRAVVKEVDEVHPLLEATQRPDALFAARHRETGVLSRELRQELADVVCDAVQRGLGVAGTTNVTATGSFVSGPPVQEAVTEKHEVEQTTTSQGPQVTSQSHVEETTTTHVETAAPGETAAPTTEKAPRHERKRPGPSPEGGPKTS